MTFFKAEDPDIVTLSLTLVWKLHRNSPFDYMCQAMRDAGVAATVITYNSLINCYARARDAAGAERVLVTMREEAGVRRRNRLIIGVNRLFTT